MKKAYVAGPITAPTSWQRELNIRRAEEIGVELVKAGFAVFVPHSLARFWHDVVPVETWLEMDLEWLECSDCVVLVQRDGALPGWRESDGARGEVRRAVGLRLPVFDTPKEAIRWLNVGCPDLTRG